jgi:cytochrome b
MALRNRNSELQLVFRVWDLPLRLCWWGLAALIALSAATALTRLHELHRICGYAVLALVLFRIVWGLVGSDTARFTNALGKSTRRQFGRRPLVSVLGIAFLLDLLVQTGTGLFGDGVGGAHGVLAASVGPRARGMIAAAHGWNFWVVISLAVLQLLALAGSATLHRPQAMRPLLCGKMRLPATTRAPRTVSPLAALAIFCVVACCVWALATRP